MRRRALLSACGTAALGVTLGSTPVTATDATAADATPTATDETPTTTDADGPVATVRAYYRRAAAATTVDGFMPDARRLSQRSEAEAHPFRGGRKPTIAH